MSLQLSRTDIVFVYDPSRVMETSLLVTNSSPTGIVTFKVKTTSPEKFDVNPSKGILMPSESKSIVFRTNGAVSRDEAQRLLAREKFLIQWMPISQMKRSQEIEEMWRQNRNNTQLIRSIRLRLIIDGVGAGAVSMTNIVSPGGMRSPGLLENNTINHAAAHLYQTATGDLRGSGATPNDDAQRLDELRLEEVALVAIQERLMQEREAQFNRMAKSSSKKGNCMGWLKKILIVLFFCAVGWGIHKYIEYRRNNPKTVITQEYHAKPAENVVRIGNERVVGEKKVVHDSGTVTTTYEQHPQDIVVHESTVTTTHSGTPVTQTVVTEVQQKPHKKVILTAPDDAEVIVNRINNQSIRLTVLGAQEDSEGLRIEY